MDFVVVIIKLCRYFRLFKYKVYWPVEAIYWSYEQKTMFSKQAFSDQASGLAYYIIQQ